MNKHANNKIKKYKTGQIGKLLAATGTRVGRMKRRGGQLPTDKDSKLKGQDREEHERAEAKRIREARQLGRAAGGIPKAKSSKTKGRLNKNSPKGTAKKKGASGATKNLKRVDSQTGRSVNAIG